MAWKGKLVIAFIMLLCATVMSTEPRKYAKKEEFVNKKIFYVMESFQNTTILYTACNVDNRQTELTCEVIQRTGYFNGTSSKHVCPLNLVDVDQKFIKTYKVGRDKAVIIYIDSTTAPEKKYLQLLNLDLTNCKTIKNKVVVPANNLGKRNWNIRLITVLPYENTYDVIFNHRFSCDDKFCKGTYDLEGKAVKGLSSWDAVPFKLPSADFVQLNRKSHTDGYLVMYKEESMTVANLVRNETKVIEEWDLLSEHAVPYVVYATNYDTIGMCLQYNKTVNCSFFDLEGKVKIRTNLSNGEEQLYAIYNLADGFLVLSQAFYNHTFEKPVKYCPNQMFYIRRYDSNGKIVKQVTINDFKWDQWEYVVFGRLFKNEFGEYCASFVSYMIDLQPPKVEGTQTVEISAQCFADL